MFNVVRALWTATKKSYTDAIYMRAAACTYYFLISIVPTAILIGFATSALIASDSETFSTVKDMALYTQIINMLSVMDVHIPMSFASVGWFSLIIWLYSAAILIGGLQAAFNRIFGTKSIKETQGNTLVSVLIWAKDKISYKWWNRLRGLKWREILTGARRLFFSQLLAHLFIPLFSIALIVLATITSTMAHFLISVLPSELPLIELNLVYFINKVLSLSVIAFAAFTVWMLLPLKRPRVLLAFVGSVLFSFYFWFLQSVMLNWMSVMLARYSYYGALGTLLLVLLWAHMIFFGLFFIAEYIAAVDKIWKTE
ncbi:hypothetical protein RsTz2092_00920 [Deferribacterales bacterium RsTz2092]|nr:hypothetical protein AGMMS49941_00810 [Deferribacterales bacterium]